MNEMVPMARPRAVIGTTIADFGESCCMICRPSSQAGPISGSSSGWPSFTWSRAGKNACSSTEVARRSSIWATPVPSGSVAGGVQAAACDGLGQVDDAPVGEAGHREADEAVERGRLIERRGEQVAGAGEEAGALGGRFGLDPRRLRHLEQMVPLLGDALALGDVEHQALHVPHATVVARHRPHDVVDPDQPAIGRRHAVFEAHVTAAPRAVAEHGEHGLAIVRMNEGEPERRLVQPAPHGIAEQVFRSMAHERDLERGRVGLPHDAVESLDEADEPRAALLRAPVLAPLIHRGGDAAGQPLGHAEIGRRVRPTLGAHEGEGAEDVAASHQRHDHGRANAQRGHQARLPLAHGHAGDRGLVGLGDQLGVGAGQHARERLGKLGRPERMPLELARHQLARRIGVGDDQSTDLATVLDQVDHAPVGQRPGEESGEAGQRGFIVERTGQHPAGLGEQHGLTSRLLGLTTLHLGAPQLLGPLVLVSLLLGDVPHHDQTHRSTRRVDARDGGVERELGTVAAEADRAGRLDPGGDGPQAAARALEVCVEHAEEALGEEPIGGAAHRIAGGAAEEHFRGPIESDHPVGRVHAHDRGRRPAQHRGQLALAGPELGLELAPGASRRDQRLRQVVELLDGEGAQRRNFPLSQRVGAVLDRPDDAPDPTGHEQREADGDQDQDPGGDVPAPARVATEQHERRHRPEREAGKEQ